MAVDSDEGKAALAQVREIALAFPEVTERPSHGSPSFFIRDKKVLASVFEDHHGDERLALWCPAGPGVQGELVEQEPERFFVPPYVGHRGWIGLRLDVDPDWDEVASVLDDAYRLVAPKTLIKLLDADSDDG
ncbi:MAG: MmcQ/YjbR family DNA-binding protein [Acidimicrobiales bacterium]